MRRRRRRTRRACDGGKAGNATYLEVAAGRLPAHRGDTLSRTRNLSPPKQLIDPDRTRRAPPGSVHHGTDRARMSRLRRRTQLLRLPLGGSAVARDLRPWRRSSVRSNRELHGLAGRPPRWACRRARLSRAAPGRARSRQPRRDRGGGRTGDRQDASSPGACRSRRGPRTPRPWRIGIRARARPAVLGLRRCTG